MSTPEAETSRMANRLQHETSPYLRQHARNPVDWYPWGDEAIERARAEDKIIFLSVGYSTCYWCHVMERESFEDDSIAAYMNDHFINIKVDREERPDVDDIYMQAVQALTGHGGWPMSVFIEPKALRPIFGGTYYPPEPRHGLRSFRQILEAIAAGWSQKRDKMLEHATNVARAVTGQVQPKDGREIGREDVRTALSQLLSAFDERHGGFGGAPKFPQPVYLELLIGCRDWVDEDTRGKIDHAVRTTLDKMATGGLYDQVGGGFHRYSTDDKWLVPHFEKMLYDNAQLLSLYSRAARLYDDAFYAELAVDIVAFVRRDLTHGDGGFYSALDAEVDAREGLNYLWTEAQIRSTLEAAGLSEHVDWALHVFGVDRGTNFQDPHHPEDPPANVLALIDRPDRLAAQEGVTMETFRDRWNRVRAALLAEREKRTQPGRDEKILTSWNGMMMAACAEAGRLLGDGEAVELAIRAARFVLKNVRTRDDGLRRSWCAGEAKIPGFLEDDAAMVRGLLHLFSATEDGAWMGGAIELAGQAKGRFWDTQRGGYFDARGTDPTLFVRPRSMYDGALPCGNSMMLLNLIDLHRLTGEKPFLDDALATLHGLSPAIAERPTTIALGTLGLKRLFDMTMKEQATPSPAAAVTASHRPQSPPEEAVRVSVASEKITIKPGEVVETSVTLTIAPGYHINANQPGRDDLIGLKAELISGKPWTLDVEYPEGEKFMDEINVHTGEVELLLQLGLRRASSDPLEVSLTWQACTQSACMPPRTVSLPLQVHSG